MEVVMFNNSSSAIAAPVNPKDTPIMYNTPEPWGTLSTDYNNTQGIAGEFYGRPTSSMMHPSPQSHEQSEAPQEPYKPNFLVIAGLILLFVLLK